MNREDLPQYAAFRQRMCALAAEDGQATTFNDALTVYRQSSPLRGIAVQYDPCLCIVAQGRKSLTIGEARVMYDDAHYLVAAIPVPVLADIPDASPEHPFVAMTLEIDMAQVAQLVLDLGDALPDASGQARHAVFASPLEPKLLDAASRLFNISTDPVESAVLLPGATRELLLRLLQGAQGPRLRQMVQAGRGERVARTIAFLRAHFDQPLDVPTIARRVGVSESTLHHSFKAATALSPMQYLKRVRLHRARVLMVADGLAAGEAAFRVGYGSPSQFSREFKRLFGETPSASVRALR